MPQPSGQTSVCILRIETEVDRLLITMTVESYLHRGRTVANRSRVVHFTGPEEAIQAVADFVRFHRRPLRPSVEWAATGTINLAPLSAPKYEVRVTWVRLPGKGAAVTTDGETACGITVHLFGGAYVSVCGDRYAVPEGSKRLLAFVALRQGRVERRHAAGALWPIGHDGPGGGQPPLGPTAPARRRDRRPPRRQVVAQPVRPRDGRR